MIVFASIFLSLLSIFVFPGNGRAEEWTSRDIAGRSRMTMQETADGKVLEIAADCSASGFFRKEDVDISSNPRLRWRWMISNVLPGADERSESTDDSPARLLVFFEAPIPRESLLSGIRYNLASTISGGALPQGPALAYVWSDKLPLGASIKSPFTERIQIIVLQNGMDKEKIGKWNVEERDPVKDFRDHFGTEPKRIVGLAVMADTDQTCRAVTASFSDIRLESVVVSERTTQASAFDHRHSKWADLLQDHTQAGLVDYAAIQKNPEKLKDYLKEIESVRPEQYEGWSQDERISFWLNAYNALVIQIVVDHYPIERSAGVSALIFPRNSIQQIPNVWREKRMMILGKSMGLDDIEHGVLRKQFTEPRIHFALVCASIGCPVLRGEPYLAPRLDEQLDDQLRRFLSDPKKARYSSAKDILYLSPIFQWFREDFDSAGGILSFLMNAQKGYLSPKFSEKISDKTGIRWLHYDWSPNEK